MNHETIKTALVSWFVGAAGLPVIWANEPGEPPPLPYGVLSRVATRSVGTANIGYTWDASQPKGQENVPTVSRHIIMTVQCEVLAGSGTTIAHDAKADAILERLKSSLDSPIRRPALKAAGLGVVRAHDVIDHTKEVNGAYESRATLDVEFSAVATYVESTGISVIETIEIESNIETHNSVDNY